MSKVLFVDDDANLLVSYHRSLRKQFEIDTALGGEIGLEKMVSNGPYAVIVSDMTMPGMNGITFLSRAKDLAPDSIRIMLTGNADLSTAVEALNSGNIFRFLLKPCLADDIAQNLNIAVEQYRLVHAEKELLEKTLHGSIRLLIEILAMANPELFGRAQGLRVKMRLLSEELGIQDIWKMELVALLSQIGVVAIPPAILQRVQARQKLSEADSAIAARVPEIGHNLVVKIPRLESVAESIRYGSVRFDGVGTPNNSIVGERIPIGARMLKVLNDLNEIQLSGVTTVGAFGLMRRLEGVYDPRILEAAQSCFDTSRRVVKKIQTGQPIKASQLTAGMVLSSDIETACGLLLVSAGHVVTDLMLEKVRNFADLSGIKEPVYVDPQQADEQSHISLAA